MILAGTTTPNCVRTTCYDANALDYNVVVVEDCCSSQTEDIQRANIADMARMGALIMSESEFESYDETTVEDMAEVIREREARRSRLMSIRRGGRICGDESENRMNNA
mgnify:CR=1 FL=1